MWILLHECNLQRRLWSQMIHFAKISVGSLKLKHATWCCCSTPALGIHFSPFLSLNMFHLHHHQNHNHNHHHHHHHHHHHRHSWYLMVGGCQEGHVMKFTSLFQPFSSSPPSLALPHNGFPPNMSQVTGHGSIPITPNPWLFPHRGLGFLLALSLQQLGLRLLPCGRFPIAGQARSLESSRIQGLLGKTCGKPMIFRYVFDLQM